MLAPAGLGAREQRFGLVRSGSFGFISVRYEVLSYFSRGVVVNQHRLNYCSCNAKTGVVFIMRLEFDDFQT